MRICLVSAAYRPYISGVGEHVHNLALGLQRRGHEVHLLTSNYPPTLSPSLPLQGGGNRREGGTPGPGREGETWDPRPSGFPVTRLGRTLVLPAHGGHFTLPFAVNLSAQVKSFLAVHEFDIVHCHGIFPPETAYWAALHARSPVVVTFHTLVFRPPMFVRSTFRFMFSGLVRRVRARIAVSRACARWAETWFPGEYRIIPNGVDTETFNPATGIGSASDAEPSILYVSRLDRRKGLPVLLRAMPEVVRQIRQVRLDVVGAGPLEKQCRETCRRLGIEESVRFFGQLSPEELPARYAGCTIFAAPTQGPESMGIILIEAMASGKPVVASDIPGYDEVVENGRSGMLVPARDPEAWARALVTILQDETLRTRLSRAARERARLYAWPGVTEQVEQVYREVTK